MFRDVHILIKNHECTSHIHEMAVKMTTKEESPSSRFRRHILIAPFKHTTAPKNMRLVCIYNRKQVMRIQI